MKGQLLSADFVVGMAILAACLGLLVNAAETSQRSNPLFYSSDAETISQALLSNVSLSSLSVIDYCYSFGNGSGTCSTFSCARNTLASHRFVPCTNGPFSTNYCYLEVRTCR